MQERVWGREKISFSFRLSKSYFLIIARHFNFLIHVCTHAHIHTDTHRAPFLSEPLLAYSIYSHTRALNTGTLVFTVVLIIILAYLFDSLQIGIFLVSLPNVFSESIVT